MAEELLFTVAGSVAVPAEAITLAEAGLQERRDLQEWVLAHPRMLGPSVMIVTFEFDRWWSAAGEHQLDRLDVLGLDEDGTLVVAELKRDRAPDTTEMQAVKYAAMASRFTIESLASQHARFRSARGAPCTDEDAMELLTAHASELSAESLRRPRIVLLAADFPPVVTATTVWLSEMGLDLTLMKFQAYRTATELLVSVSQLYPVPDVEDFTVTPRQAEVRAAQETRRRVQDVSAVKRLVDAQAIKDGTEFTLRPWHVAEEVAEAVDEWIKDDSQRGRATWQNKANAPLVWAADGNEYSPTGLTKDIVSASAGVERQFQGTRWWINEDGQDLVELSAELVGGNAHLYAEFWTAFLDRVRTEHADWSNATRGPAQNWLDLSSPIRGAHYSVSFARRQRLRSELYVDTGEHDSTRALFEAIQAHKTDIESAYGGQISWQPIPDRRASRIAEYVAGEISDLSSHEKYLDWFIDSQERLRKALGPILASLGPVSSTA